MTLEHMAFDLGKLALQAGATALVAYFAVGWALSRYKKEKTWERRLSAYADTVAALSEMRYLLGLWAEAIESDRSYDEKLRSEQMTEYKAAASRFRDSIAIARLMLPSQTYQTLYRLEIEIERISEEDAHTAHSTEYSLIDDALELLTAQGRESLGIDTVKRAKTHGVNSSAANSSQ